MHRIVILGGGPAGTITANHLTQELTPRIQSGDVAITVISDQPDQVYKPGFLYMAFGLEQAKAIHRPVQELVSPLVDVRIDPVTRVDPDTRRVTLASGASLPYDQLIIATGCRLDHDATPGLAEAGDGFYDEAGAEQLYAKLAAMTEGRIVTSVIGVPHMCPVAPLEFTLMLDDWLRTRGVRDAFELTYTYPINRTHSIQAVADWAATEFEKRDVAIETFFNAEKVDPERKVLESMEGTELPFDLLVAVPEHRSAAFLADSGLTRAGWVPTDRSTLAVEGFDGVWALGDTTGLPTPKAGSVAHYQAATIAKNVIARVDGGGPVARYDGKTICFIEAGLDRATFLEFDYHRMPTPTRPTKAIHWAKLAYNSAYWLTAKGAL
jgi:sulfide:quinone oxidoreductase